MRSPVIAVTLGDPAGIGPEIVARLIHGFADRTLCRLIIIGSRECLSRAQELIGDRTDVPVASLGEPLPTVSLMDVGEPNHAIQPGALDAEAGRLAYLYIRAAVDLAVAGKADAIVTAPINKEALHLAGLKYAGHTDMLADLTHSPDSYMLLVHDRLRVSHVTTHIPIADVPSQITQPRVERVIALSHEVLLRLGIEKPRIAVAGLNPHAGEDGLFGTEEAAAITPAIAAKRREGLEVTGPISGDVVFVRAAAGHFDLVVAMYHDQGHIPVKLLGFKIDERSGQYTGLSGVNLTLGLPIIRTSVDHGTAFDIAGKGLASAQSLEEAVGLAVSLTVPRMNQSSTRA